MNEFWSCDVAVIDDDEAVLGSFRFMLEMAGLRVATYDSALDYLEREPGVPHCLILDHHMPGMTGLDLAERLRAEAREMPIMLITSAPSPAVVERAGRIRGVRLLGKPPTEEALIAFVMA